MRVIGKNESIVATHTRRSRTKTATSSSLSSGSRGRSSSNHNLASAASAAVTFSKSTEAKSADDNDPYYFAVSESLMMYCSDRFCCGVDNDGVDDRTVNSFSFHGDGDEYGVDETRDVGHEDHHHQHEPISSMDPEYVFREELRVARQLKRSMKQSSTSYDEWSCDSSLSSTGIASMASNSIVSRSDSNSIQDTPHGGTHLKQKERKKVVVVMDSLTTPNSTLSSSSHSPHHGIVAGGSRRSIPVLDRVDERPYKEEHGSSSSSSSSSSPGSVPGSSKLFDDIFGGTATQKVLIMSQMKKRSSSSRTVAGDGRTTSPYLNRDYQHQDHRHHSRQSSGGGNSMWMSLSVLDDDRFNHRVLGTSATDEATRPHVLTNEIMDDLQQHLPYSKQGEYFWLKYSMVRDGASLRTVLHKTKLSSYTIMAVETLDGEVFGAFTARPWHIAWKYFGTPESFLWRLSGPKQQAAAAGKKSSSSSKHRDNRSKSSRLEVFRFAGNNPNVQLCNDGRIAVGGGVPDEDSVVSDDLSYVKLTEWGFGLAFGKNLQQGTSSPCTTFNSPSLSRLHPDGSCFEVANIEFWTLTPCLNVDDARRMEEGKHFIEREGVMSCR